MTKDTITQMAFEIISNAGDAMDQYYEALIDLKKNRNEQAKIKLEEGNKFLNKTHEIQTKLIQSEVNEEDIPYSLIMTHAQDHLNSAINWQRIVTLFLEE